MNNLSIHCVRASTSKNPEFISMVYNTFVDEKIGKAEKNYVIVDSNVYCNRMREHFYNVSGGGLDFLMMQVMMTYTQTYTNTMIIKDI